MEVPGQKVRRDIESVIAIRCDLAFLQPLNADAILAHQPANSAMTDVQTHLFQTTDIDVGAGDEIRTHDIYLGKVTLYP